MNAIRFQAHVDQEGVIRPPDGIVLPPGKVEVSVRQIALRDDRSEADGSELEATRMWLLSAAQEAERLDVELPGDLAEHHDHYAHGKPLS